MKAGPILNNSANTKKGKKYFFGAKKKLDKKPVEKASNRKIVKEIPKLGGKASKTTDTDQKSDKLALSKLQDPVNEIHSTSNKYNKHKDPQKVSDEKYDAALLTSKESNELVANRNQVDVMSPEKKDFDKENFRKKLKEQINDTIKSKADAKKIGQEGVADKDTEKINETLAEEKEKAGGEIESSTLTPPAKPVTPANEITTSEPVPLKAEKALAVTKSNQKSNVTPDKKPEAEVDFEKETKVLDDDYEKNNLNTDKLQNSNEPRFIQADNQKNDSKEKAKQLSSQYKTDETKIVKTTQAQNINSINEAYGQMLKDHTSVNKKTGQLQQDTAQEEFQIRKKISVSLDAIFNDTNTKVLQCFTKIDIYVERIFGEEMSRYLNRFSERVAELLDDNTGIINNIGAFVTGDELLSEVQIFDIAKKEFIENMQDPIDRLVNFVDDKLFKASSEVKKGKENVDKFWEKQPQKYKRIAGDLYETSKEKFEELESSIESKQTAVIDTVTEKFSSALDELDERFEKAKIENMSWLDRAVAAVKAVINTIIELKNAFVAVAEKAAKYAEQIIDDPLTFFGNLGDGVGLGFKNFKNNIEKHLVKGVLEWLTGSMSGIGIELPKELNFEGITSLVLQILGITIKKLKDIVISAIGKERFEFIEKGVDASIAAGNKILNIFKILNEKGLAGLWEFIKEEFSNLKEMLIENVKTFVIETIAMKAVEFLLSLMAPGGGFIRAAQMIIKFVVTLFQKAADIIRIIDGIVESFGNILRRDLAGAASVVENVLSGFLSLAINFLAAVLGLNGIVGKVQKFINKTIKPKIDKVLNNIGKKLKEIVTKIGLIKLIDKSKAAVQKGQAWIEEKKQKAKDTAKKIGEKVLDILGIKKRFKAADGNMHTLFFEGKADNPKLMIASDKMTYEKFLADVVPDTNPEKVQAIGIAKKIDQVKGSKYTSDADDKPARKAEEEKREKEIEGHLDDLSKLTASFFGVQQEGEVTHTPEVRGGATIGKSVTVEHLSKKGRKDKVKGSAPKDTANKVWDVLKKRKKGNGTYYIRGHLLNDNIFGPGVWENMAPIPGAFNTGIMEPQIESQAKKAVFSGGTIDFKLDFVFGRPKTPILPTDSPEIQEVKNNEEHVPLSLLASLSLQVDNQKKDLYKDKSLTIDIDSNYDADKIEKPYTLDKKSAVVHQAHGIPQSISENLEKHFSRATPTKLNDYVGQIGCSKEKLLEYVKNADKTYTDIQQFE